jgi:hypothetical protein
MGNVGIVVESLDLRNQFRRRRSITPHSTGRAIYNTEWFGPEMPSYVTAVKNREMSGPKFFEACDGVFLDIVRTPNYSPGIECGT